uniref:Computational designed protein based on structure template 1cy5 n=1 Tax=synthetic construct TaxID=32630 RepID=UPI00052238E5|nr:Chain A, Computational designed protein based on structure template 1cy5 [synthetic construct]
HHHHHHMTPEQREFLPEILAEIIANLDPTKILEELLRRGLLTPAELQEVLDLKTPEEQAKKLIDFILKLSPADVQARINVLRAHGYQALADKLNKYLTLEHHHHHH